MTFGRSTLATLPFREAKSQAQTMSESTSGDRLLPRIKSWIVSAEGKITIYIDADELFDQSEIALMATTIAEMVQLRSEREVETRIVAVVRSITHATKDIVATAEKVAAQRRKSNDEDLIEIVDRSIASNRGTENLLYDWKHRFESGRWQGSIDFRAADQSTGVDFIAIAHESPQGNTEFIRIACDRISGYAPFATTARVTKEPALAREQSKRFADRWVVAMSNPPAIHHPGLAAEMIRVYREGISEIEKLAHREIEIFPTILQQINEIY